MSKRTVSIINGTLFVPLVARCLLPVLLASCGTEATDDTATPTALATITVAPAQTSTALPTHTPALGVNEVEEPPAATKTTLTPTGPPPIESTSTEHTVQAGDTLLGLARQYGVPMAAIQLHNEMGESTVVQVGQTLLIPPQANWENVSPFWVVHVVKEGETLIGIAHTYDLKAETLQAVNDLTNADLIEIGQELVLPLDAPVVARAPTPTATPPPTATPAPSPTVEVTAVPPTPTAVPAATPPADVAAWPRETVRLINEVRAQHGLSPLTYNETLAQAAQAHANDCVQRGWCSHTGSDGADIKTRIIRAGYDPSGWAECWAQSQSPRHAVDVWMDEEPPNDPHRRTLLTTWLSEIGVGVAKADWGYYFIADFGRP